MTWLAIPLVQAAIAGALAAASVDLAAFRSWKTWGDVQHYNWTIASFRWFQGAVVGAISGLGLSALAP